MAIDFRVRDFLQPAAIVHTRWLLERAQWWPPDRLGDYQMRRLRAVLTHAAADVPFWRTAFAAAGVQPDQVRAVSDLRRLPVVTKRTVLEAGAAMVARDVGRFDPVTVASTGTSGPALSVLVDRRTNALEFAFYWRHWGWFGYRLGDRFAHLAWSPFRGAHRDRPSVTERVTGRLLLNATSLSPGRARDWASAMVRHRARFLKGHPSALLHFALFVREQQLDLPPLRAVFTTGEVLQPETRRLIQSVFGAPVADAYGSMERVVAACECPSGRMHINADYGLWDVEATDGDPLSGQPRARIIGTGLYNYSMPLIRFDLGDVVDAPPEGPCPCGRTLPTVGRIHGRSVDAITTPDGRVITAAAVVFNGVPGILRGQLVQDESSHLHVRVLPTPAFDEAGAAMLTERMRVMFGAAMSATVERVTGVDDFGPDGEKHRAVISRVTQQAVAAGRALP